MLGSVMVSCDTRIRGGVIEKTFEVPKSKNLTLQIKDSVCDNLRLNIDRFVEYDDGLSYLLGCLFSRYQPGLM